MCTARTHICAHVKDPISICRKRVGLTAGGMKTRKHCVQEEKEKKKKMLGSAVLWLLAFPGGKQPEFAVHCTGTRKLSSNLLLLLLLLLINHYIA